MLRKQFLIVFSLFVGTFASAAGQTNPPVSAPPSPPPVVVPTQTTAAQQAAAARGNPVSNEQIADALRKSGLSESQVRERLRLAGYDEKMADPFFGKGAGGNPMSPTPAQETAFKQALVSLGILASDAPADTIAHESAKPTVRTSSRIFGKDVFSGIGSQFDPVTAGPVDPSYRVGVGDQLQLVVTGEVELAYQLDIRRDGTVIVPDVGQIPLAGLTLDAARAVVKSRMSASYSDLSTGAAHLDLTISRLRVNSVFVIGEVESPGSYQVNALSTVFYALARAGGPTERGSFRRVEVRRGGRTIRTIDLYDYLLRGDASNDIRTEQGDIIFVPLNTRSVSITGAVRRPGIFELTQAEQLPDLLDFAGGLLASASLERVQIDRVLPPEFRRPGFDRVKTDVELHGRLDSLRSVKLYDSDIVEVFSVGELRRNTVNVIGAVFQPGEFEFTPGMTLDTLISKVQGTLPWALTDRIKITRSIPQTGRTESFSLDLGDPAARNFRMAEYDQVTVLDARSTVASFRISVLGAVQQPFEAQYVENMTLKDAIDLANGLREDASVVSVARRHVGASYSDTTSTITDFPVQPGLTLPPSTAQFIIAPDDRIIVRGSPGYRSQRFATVEGLFQQPGVYPVNESADRLRDLVYRAGGLLPTAYPESFQLIRGGAVVAVDFDKALHGDPTNNVFLQNGDKLIISSDPRTVSVRGAVTNPSLIVFRPGLSVTDYIEMAGGPTENGNRHKATVLYPSGYSRRIRSFLGLTHSEPTVASGSVITVPTKPESKDGWEAWQRILATLTTFFLGYAAVTR